MYAEEDDLDQVLCRLGSLLGIDIIVLTNMIGSNQIVTEVLDTRERDVSMSSLIFDIIP